MVESETEEAGMTTTETIETTGAEGAAGASAARDVLVVKNLCVYYATPEGEVKAVEDVSFSLWQGERFALVGESGCGKSTLAMGLMRLTRAPGRIVSGQVFLNGRDLLALEDRELRALRLSEIALIPQGAMNSLNPVMRVAAQIIDGLADHQADGNGKNSDEAHRQRVDQLLTTVGLPPSVKSMYPHELSGGMKQRVAMAIATSLSPTVIVADEPTSALDVVVQRQIMQTLGRLQAGLEAAVLLVGHDMGLVAQFADTIGVMYAGRLVEVAPVQNIFKDPQHPYTRMLIQSLPTLDEKRDFVGIPGMPPTLLNLPPECPFHPRCPHAMDICRSEFPAQRELGPRRQVSCHLYSEDAS